QGSDMRHTGLYFTEGEEHLDLFTTDRHEAGHTTGDTVWKGALTGNSRASYEGLIHIVPNAQESHTYLQTHQMLLSQKAKGDAIPSLIVETDSVSASHGGTVGELDEEQIFYTTSRGIPRSEAVRILVEGYFEEVVQRLDDEGLQELVRRRIARKLADAEDQVAEFIGKRA
ncbi:MAG: SufD family Fe-S cluster assembly protein, partial [Thermoleophilaceae bacterium]